MQRYLLFTYALISYLAAIASVALLILWVYPWPFMPATVDKGSSGEYALVVNIFLIALFGLQHSIMARPAFKAAVFAKRSVSFRASTYTLASALCLLVMMLFWQPMEAPVWSLASGPLFWLSTLLYTVGWTLAFIATFQIDHFALFGLHQGYRVLKRQEEPEARFKKRGFYRYVRHPIQTATLLGLWATPVMSEGHLLLSSGLTLYILIGLMLEEKDLVKTLGRAYTQYKKEVPMLLPLRGRSEK